jgi:hypothetical protein
MDEKNPAAVALGRAGGLARAKNLSAKQLSQIAKKAGKASGRERSKKAKPVKA